MKSERKPSAERRTDGTPAQDIRSDLNWLLSEHEIEERLYAFFKEQPSNKLQVALQDDVLDLSRLIETSTTNPEKKLP